MPVDYLRIAVTDRCNLRCTYCMPEEGIAWREPGEILSYEEIVRFARVAAGRGLTRIRLTGGEPLVRKDVDVLIRELTAAAGPVDLALTTNGTLLAGYAERLAAAGLKRINVSLDSLDPRRYAELTRRGRLGDVLEGLDAALEAGLDPVKVNVVVFPDLLPEIEFFVEMVRVRPVHVRFVEYMPVANERCAPKGRFVPNLEVMRRLEEFVEIQLAPSPAGGGPARYFTFDGAKGTLGFISSSSNHFCGDCNRLRLTADGALRTCLFSSRMYDLRDALRAGPGDGPVRKILEKALLEKPGGRVSPKISDRLMHEIGG